MMNFTACHDHRAYKFDPTTVLLDPVAIDDINEWCWVFESGKKDGN
jgi:hypothetical protein